MITAANKTTIPTSLICNCCNDCSAKSIVGRPAKTDIKYMLYFGWRRALVATRQSKSKITKKMPKIKKKKIVTPIGPALSGVVEKSIKPAAIAKPKNAKLDRNISFFIFLILTLFSDSY